jgi:hypothetical protein
MRIHRALPGSGQTPIRPPHSGQRHHHVSTTALRQEPDRGVSRTQPHLNAVPKPDALRPATRAINTNRADRLLGRYLASLVQRREVGRGHTASLTAGVCGEGLDTQRDCPKGQTSLPHTANWHTHPNAHATSNDTHPQRQLAHSLASGSKRPGPTECIAPPPPADLSPVSRGKQFAPPGPAAHTVQPDGSTRQIHTRDACASRGATGQRAGSSAA